MNRQTAVLRELGLYPLWQRREMPVVDANLLTRAEQEFAPMRVVDTAVEIPHPEMSAEPRANWATLHPQIETCQRCDLHAGCLQTVCGTGDPDADWLWVGDWSSEEDDVQGEPFMGAAGKLLDNMLRAIALNRQQNVYLTNVLKCRPPEQHHRLSHEIEQCLPYLYQQIALIKPKKIIALGNTAAHALLGGNAPLKTLRGQIQYYQNIPVIVTYHPAYLLRSPLEKAQVWADLCLALRHSNT